MDPYRKLVNRLATTVGLALSCIAATTTPAQGPPPWERTESRTDCSQFELLRSPFFGETHVHTQYSADAWVAGALGTPNEAYEFAKGAPLGLPPLDAMGIPTRSAQLKRPLDFTIVTDHAEQFGEVQMCQDPLSAGYNEIECTDMRDLISEIPFPPPPSPLPDIRVINFLLPYLVSPSSPFSWCGLDRVDCLAAAAPIWADTQAAAELHYDRTGSCQFTTFVGYEWTAAPPAAGVVTAVTMHRNVVFRNNIVPDAPASFIEEQKIQGLFAALESECLDPGLGCDVLTIPHNSNLSGGQIWEPLNDDGSPFTAADAVERRRMEPLAEIINHKGESECQPGVGTTDELCGFEKAYRPTTLTLVPNPDPTLYNPLSFIRNALKEGLSQEQSLGVNPYNLGFVGGTDTHNSTPGLVNEEEWGGKGHNGLRDHSPDYLLSEFPPSGIPTNPSGVAVVWAEENSRDALFAAMRRRETYATSGTRPLLRLFAGDFKGDLCAAGDLVEQGYRRGVPMGGEIGDLRKGKSPQFAVLAVKDPGGGGAPSTDLQRVQIIKGWIDDSGIAREKVFEVAGDPANGATVDENTCTPSGAGFDSLCTVWEDPDFNPSQRAFYYARVLENPVCRWSTHLCNSLGVDCDDLPSVPPNYTSCCNPLWPKTIQERAWSSPVFYRPESFSKFKSSIKLKGGGQDTLKIVATLGSAPSALDPNTEAVSVTLTDDDTIYAATLPAGTMEEKKPGQKWSYSSKDGAIDGIKKATLKLGPKGDAKLVLKTVKLSLDNADATEHFIHSKLSAGAFEAEHMRVWQTKGTSLKPEN
ncbi:MAG: DUF3604 domain-containing protein [Candidatus Binatia bacterium]